MRRLACATLAWLASATALAASAPLTLASWNLQWLADPTALQAAQFWARCTAQGLASHGAAADLPPCDAWREAGIDSAHAYAQRKLEPVRRTLAALAERRVDVLALQEVHNTTALQAVLPPGYRVACTTRRASAQNLAFALREAAGLQAECREIPALSLEHGPHGRALRPGLELTLRRHGHRAALLNLHLKSGCAFGAMDREQAHCALLQRQAAPLEDWIEQQAAAGGRFALLGDWNRDLPSEARDRQPARADGSDARAPLTDATRLRRLWPELNDGAPPASRLYLARLDRQAAAQHGCHRLLDHLASNARGVVAQFVAPAAGASDHCPLVSALPWR
ncbi:MAG: endonuclease/exonuclease/phosphatase family protein [Pseudomonadota bacterium]